MGAVVKYAFAIAILAVIAAVTQSGKSTIKVTVLVGGSMNDRLGRVDEPISRADECLYCAKKMGRNCIVIDWQGDTRALTA